MKLGHKFKSGDLLPTAAWFNSLTAHIKANTIQPSTSIRVRRSQAGVTLVAAPKGRAAPHKGKACKLGTMSPNKDNSTNRDISAGIISGAGASYAVGVGSPDGLGVNMTPSPGQYVYAKLTWDVTVIDEVLQGGGELSNVTIETGPSVPVNDVATEESESIHGYVCLGWWYKPAPAKDTISWNGAGCGSIDVSFCYGSRQLTYTRNDG